MSPLHSSNELFFQPPPTTRSLKILSWDALSWKVAVPFLKWWGTADGSSPSLTTMRGPAKMAITEIGRKSIERLRGKDGKKWLRFAQAFDPNCPSNSSRGSVRRQITWTRPWITSNTCRRKLESWASRGTSSRAFIVWLPSALLAPILHAWLHLRSIHAARLWKSWSAKASGKRIFCYLLY